MSQFMNVDGSINSSFGQTFPFLFFTHYHKLQILIFIYSIMHYYKKYQTFFIKYYSQILQSLIVFSKIKQKQFIDLNQLLIQSVIRSEIQQYLASMKQRFKDQLQINNKHSVKYVRLNDIKNIRNNKTHSFYQQLSSRVNLNNDQTIQPIIQRHHQISEKEFMPVLQSNITQPLNKIVRKRSQIHEMRNSDFKEFKPKQQYSNQIEEKEEKEEKQKREDEKQQQIKQYKGYPRDKIIQIKLKKGVKIIQWVGQMMQKVSSEAFASYVKKQINFNEAKVMCSRNYLFNILKIATQQNMQGRELSQVNDHIMNTSSYLCNLYPQTQQTEVNKKLKEAIQFYRIDNYEDDNYDLIELSKIQFKLKQRADYSRQIMQFINYIIQMPFRSRNLENESRDLNQISQSQNNMAPFTKFNLLLSTIFQRVYRKNPYSSYADIKQVLDFEKGFDIIKQATTILNEEELEYQQKVKSYTSYLINVKMSENTPTFSDYQMESGMVKSKSNSVKRVLTKWLYQLLQKIKDCEKFINNRVYRFKGNVIGERKKLNTNNKQVLLKKLQQIRAKTQIIQKQYLENLGQSIKKLLDYSVSIKGLDYMDPLDKAVGYFAVMMNNIGTNAIMESLSQLIHFLLSLIQQIKQNWLQNNNYYRESPIFKTLDINLITCKIGDIIRCKCISKENQIIRIFGMITQLSNMKESKLLKIIRVKNRLNQGTRDILINVFFDNVTTCEIQLAVQSTKDEKQLYFDKFNHFLYEIKRSKPIPINQICQIWNQYDPRASIFQKYIQKQENEAKKNRYSCPNKQELIVHQNYSLYNFPLVCQFCKLFIPFQQTIFHNKIQNKTLKTICGHCVSKKVSEEVVVYYLMLNLSTKIPTLSMNCSGVLTRLHNFDQLVNTQYCIAIPINSKEINFHFLRKLIFQKNIYFVTSKIIQKKGKPDIHYQCIINMSQKSPRQLKCNQYVYYRINMNFQMEKINVNTKFRNQFVTKDLLNKLQKIDPQMKIASITCDSIKAILPYFQKKQKQTIVNEIQINKNLKNIKNQLKLKKNVLQLDKKQLTIQFNMISPKYKVYLENQLTELYIRQNQISEISIVTSLKQLKVLQANYNKIKIIPQMPPLIQQVDLGSNRIQIIQGFNFTNTKISIINLHNNLITEINGLKEIPSLIELYLLKNKIKRISNLQYLVNLRRLSLASNEITQIQNIDKLTFLELFNISNNKLSWQKYQFKLKNLKLFLLNRTKLKQIYFNNVQNQLQALHFYGNQIQKIQNLESYKDLQQLNLNANRIRTIQNLSSLRKIKLLQLNQNLIEKIQGLSQLVQLQSLFLQGNQIKQIQGLQCLYHLNFLNLNKNKIEKIEGLQQLYNLNKLYLSFNKIKKVQNLLHLNRANQIRLNDNQIESVIKLPRLLKIINLSNNKLTNAKWLIQYPRLDANISGNQILKQQQESMTGFRLLLNLNQRNENTLKSKSIDK